MKCVAFVSLFCVALGGLSDSQVAWSDKHKCSGSADPKGTFPMCYEGSAGAMGVKEDVKVKLLSYANGKGTMDLQGSGIEGIKCTGKNFTKNGAKLIPDISACLPKLISLNKVEYCSDQDQVFVTVKDSKVPVPVSATLKKVSCPVEGAALKNRCSGSADPTGTFPKCYEGASGAMGVEEDIKVKIFSYSSGKGTMDLVGSGVKGIKCSGKGFTKSGQQITPAMSDCLPKVISVQKVEYCSDQDQVSVTVKDSHVPLPVSATLRSVTCTGDEAVVLV